jgi:hypothetical protein
LKLGKYACSKHKLPRSFTTDDLDGAEELRKLAIEADCPAPDTASEGEAERYTAFIHRVTTSQDRDRGKGFKRLLAHNLRRY